MGIDLRRMWWQDVPEMGTPLYESTTRCRDLPELIPPASGDELVHIAMPEGDLDRVVAAVRSRQPMGGTCQEKVDGCYVELHLDAAGVVDSVTSRAGLDHQYAQDWLGQRMQSVLHGWTLQGEIVAGTHWAAQERDPGKLPLIYIYGMLGRAGRVVDDHEEIARKVRWIGHPRLRVIRQAKPGEDWGDFCRGICEAGGEGVVLRQSDGRWRAKPLVGIDRLVRRVFQEPDRHGALRWKAECCRYGGGRAGWQVTNTCLIPEWCGKPEKLLGRVVVLAGATVDQKTGTVRHGRIGQVRLRGEVRRRDCR